ncbi:MAG TPA: type III-B CRISPR module-associated protein Cmr5, partial [Negativicutes bacterium]|nr:type III-B CRISPR module-associated protein Cmr5 [Negativicutes bacterium]
QILNNGFGETIAFHFSKSKKENDGAFNAHWYVCDQLRNWLVEQQYLRAQNIEEVALEVVSLSVADSRVVTNETLAFLNWLRRFTDGIGANMAASTGNSDSHESTS